MKDDYLLITERLGIRRWSEADVDSWATLCADAEVMAYFPKKLTRPEAKAWIANQQSIETQFGYCFWPVVLLETGELIGMTGLHPLPLVDDDPTAVEIGWRLHRRFWGKGYATEAALACRYFAWEVLHQDYLYAVASEINESSIRVMDKLDMQLIKRFNHPSMPVDSPLQPCVLYRTELTR